MSDSQAYEAVTVASDGVSVTKRFEEDEFPVPAIAFQFESERSEPVTVRLTDVVPDDVSVEDLGFHPEYGSEYWTIDDDEISFERDLDPEAEYTTVYGIRATGTDNVEQFLTEPSIAEVDPPLAEDESDLVGEGSDAVKDVIAGESDTVPGLDEEQDGDDEDVGTLDLNDPNDAAAAGDGLTQAEARAAVLGDNETVLGALLTELRNDEVSPQELELLKRALDTTASDGATKARLDKLQGDVDEVLAYTEALETFLDENGTGDDVIEGFQDEIDAFRETVESFESDLSAVEETATTNEEDLSGLEDTVADLEDRLADVEDDLSSIREDVGDDDVQDRVEEIDEEIAELKQWREQLSSVIGGGD